MIETIEKTASPAKSMPASSTPLLDIAQVQSWQNDLEADDVRDILASTRQEALKAVGEIGQLINRGDRPALKRCAHKLKGMAANLGASRMAMLLRHLELGAETIELDPSLVLELQRTVDETMSAFDQNL